MSTIFFSLKAYGGITCPSPVFILLSVRLCQSTTPYFSALSGFRRSLFLRCTHTDFDLWNPFLLSKNQKKLL